MNLTWEFTAADSSPPWHIESQGAARYPGEWFACEQPERPFDNRTGFHDCCMGCLIALDAEYRLGRNDGSTLEHMRARIEKWGLAPRLGADA